jgi:hypothetical protein
VRTNEAHLRPRPSRGDRLVRTFASGVTGEVSTEYRFARFRQMIAAENKVGI